MTGQHIDPASGAIPADLDLRLDEPPSRPKRSHHPHRHADVGGVALPCSIGQERCVDVEAETSTHGREDALGRGEAEFVHQPTLDPRQPRLRHPEPPGEPLLRPSEGASQVADRLAQLTGLDFASLHPRMKAGGT